MTDQQKRSRSLYMTVEAYRMLRKLGEQWGLSENQATERAIREAHRDLVQSGAEDEPESESGELVAQLVSQVEYMKEQLRVRDEEIRRRDHLMAAALERIPALEQKSEESEAHSGDLRASEETPRGRGREDSGDDVRDSESGGWWKRWVRGS